MRYIVPNAADDRVSRAFSYSTSARVRLVTSPLKKPRNFQTEAGHNARGMVPFIASIDRVYCHFQAVEDVKSESAQLQG